MRAAIGLRKKRIIITRAEEQSSAFANALREAGAEVVSLPAIAIIEPEKGQRANDAARAVADGRYGWIVFTSQNGVRYFSRALERLGLDASAFGSTKIATVGPATSRSVDALGLTSHLSPKEFVAEALARDLLRAMRSQKSSRPTRVLLPRAKVARDVIPRELAALGVEVDVVTVYETVDPPAKVVERGRAQINAETIDAVAFTSGSTVERFVRLYGRDVFDRGAKVATIGPITSAAARALDLPVDIEATAYTTTGLVEALVRAFAKS